MKKNTQRFSITGNNQIASEKDYPIDFSHFNINGRVFGAQGANETQDEATIFNVNLERTYGFIHPVRMAMPIILPALIKLNWQDYFAGAAMAGVTCVIGEHARNNEPNLKIDNGKVTDFPLLKKALDCFNRYDRGYGQIVLQCNVDDDLMGVPKIAIEKYGAKAIEIKFGQAAKGTQPVIQVKDLETALVKQQQGNLLSPDPSDPSVQKAYHDGVCPNFYTYGRLPLWTENSIMAHITKLRDMGAQNIYFKMAGYDRVDIERVLRMACEAQVDMVTFDGAGGGSGYSPSKMMNEWSLPTVCLEDVVVRICEQLKFEGFSLPAMVMTGVFSYLNKIAFGLKHFAALNRKFNMDLLNKSDLIPLTSEARSLMANEWFAPSKNSLPISAGKGAK